LQRASSTARAILATEVHMLLCVESRRFSMALPACTDMVSLGGFFT
jgi:hypothetical protein